MAFEPGRGEAGQAISAVARASIGLRRALHLLIGWRYSMSAVKPIGLRTVVGGDIS
jgi:hypothetical protein